MGWTWADNLVIDFRRLTFMYAQIYSLELREAVYKPMYQSTSVLDADQLTDFRRVLLEGESAIDDTIHT